jgi:hypothetical protein
MAVPLIDLESLRVAKAVAPTFFLEAREVGAFFKEVLAGTLLILEGLLQRLRRRFG